MVEHFHGMKFNPLTRLKETVEIIDMLVAGIPLRGVEVLLND